MNKKRMLIRAILIFTICLVGLVLYVRWVGFNYVLRMLKKDLVPEIATLVLFVPFAFWFNRRYNKGMSKKTLITSCVVIISILLLSPFVVSMIFHGKLLTWKTLGMFMTSLICTVLGTLIPWATRKVIRAGVSSPDE